MLSECAGLIEEKDYCDQGQLLLQEYEGLKMVEFSEELGYLEKWAVREDQPCLLVTGEAESGKKALLYSFLKASKQAHPNWVFISQFASVTPMYYNILYKTMTELRNHFKIDQKVDLNGEKLRRYFKYWLEVTSDFLKKEYLGYHPQQIPKVVIMLEGIDLCIDSKGNKVEPQFWLPSEIPSNIKLILTSKNEEPQLVKNCTVLRHQMSKHKREQVIASFTLKIQQLSSQNEALSLHCLNSANSMVTTQPEFELKDTQFQDIFNSYIAHVSGPELTEEVIKSLLYILTLTRKGIRSKQLSKMVSLSASEWKQFETCFSFLMVSAQGHFIICNQSSCEMIQRMVDPEGEKMKAYRHSIVVHIKKELIQLRDLEEMVYQLLLSENYGELKEVVSRVENFIMLYTPLSKELLCQCWVRLEQIEQFDPVYEYNKAIESYTSHYYPKEEDLYKIIFQMCLFFKEYAEFQNPRTPVFRHPLIKGEVDNLESIGIYDELKSLTMIGKCKSSKLKPIDKGDTSWKGSYSKMDSNESKLTVSLKEPLLRKNRTKMKSRAEASMTARSKVTSEKTSEKLILEDIPEETQRNGDLIRYSSAFEESSSFNVEELNVGILTNQQKFRQHFVVQMKEYLEDYFVPLKKASYKEKELTFEADDSDNEEEERGEREFRVDIEQMRTSFILKHFREYLEETYHKTGEELQYYYYKQWIWLQFPWLCQSIKHAYSSMLKECLPGSIHFMSPLREFTFIRDAIRIVRTAKENKLGVFNDKKLEILPIRIKGSKQQLAVLAGGKTGRLSESKSKLNLMSSVKKSFIDIATSQYRLNSTNLDEEIMREREEEYKIKEKCGKGLKRDNSMPNINLFVTETSAQRESRVLPSLKKSKFAVEKVSRRREKETEKENRQDSRDFTLIIRKYNEYKHENEMLIEKIEEARKVEGGIGERNEEEVARLTASIDDFEGRKHQLDRNYKNQVELRKKLEMIIKICDLNKMYGSETDYLSHYLESLKKMIDCEEGKMSETRLSIQDTVERGKGVIRELRSKKKELRAHQEQLAAPFNNMLSNSTNERCSGLALDEIEEELQEMGRSIKLKSKKTTKNNRERYFLSYKDYEILEQEIGIVYGQENETKVQDFADKFEKLKELKLKNGDLMRDLQVKKKEVESVRSYSQMQSQGESRDKEIRTANLLVDRRRELTQLKNRNLLLQHAVSVLNE